MVGLEWIGLGRALALGLATDALAACATSPAPVSPGPRAARSVEPPVPYAPGSGPRVTDYSARLQCVPFAREASGVEIYGDANTWWVRAEGRYPRSSQPAPGSVLVVRGYRDTGRGHVAVVTRIESSRLIIVDHANWLNGGEISVDVPVLDVSPDNDWSQIRVWYIPGAHWGGRVYETQGFIHPFALHAALG
jgi:surface antigen